MGDDVNVKNVEKVALYSRLAFLLISCISNLLIPDHEPDSFTSPPLYSDVDNPLDKLVGVLFGGLVRWDSQHFMHVARYGYTYETNLAFFPLFPTAVRYGSIAVTRTTGMNFRSSFATVSVVLNTILFVKSSVVLYRLSKILFKCEWFAFNSALSFCLSPATIFFLAPYSETMFTFCTLNGMLHYARQDMKLSCVWFCIGASTRSNGIINVGFIFHYYFYKIIVSLKTFSIKNIRFIKSTIKYLIYSLISLVSVLSPYILFQVDGYYRFCRGIVRFPQEVIEYGAKHHLVIAGNKSVWCANDLPMPYAYVQDRYWDVGFLRYFSFKQIPNFCLALVTVSMLLHCVDFLLKNKILFVQPDLVYKTKEAWESERRDTAFPERTFVYIVHAVSLTIFCFFNINVQVTTRMIASSSPVLYWIASSELAAVTKRLNPKDDEPLNVNLIALRNALLSSNEIIVKYFAAYAVIGTVLFTNNFPWT